ncbi:hypothetical protein Tco_1144452 [Tanacetum coccineum]
MNELNELRDQAYENSLIYKEKTKKIHDSKIKNHQATLTVGELRVLLSILELKGFSRASLRPVGPDRSPSPKFSLMVPLRTDISQKDEKPSKKQQNRTRDGKVCENEAKSKSSQLREEKAKKNIT